MTVWGTGRLPAGWSWSTLGELGAWSGGATPSKSNTQFWTDGTVPWLSPKDMGSSLLTETQDRVHSSALTAANLKLVPGPSVALVVRSGILERKVPVALVPFDTTLNQDMKAVRPAGGVDARWLAFALEALESTLLRDCRKAGTTVASLEFDRVLALPVAVPPAAEQQRIVLELQEQLSRLEAARKSVGGLRGALQGLHRRSLSAAVRGELLEVEPEGESGTGAELVERRCAQRGTSASSFREPWTLPASWAWARIGDLFDVHVGTTPSRSEPSLWGGTVPWVSSGEVAFNRIARTRETITEKALGNRDKRLHRPGTVMLAMIGEGKTRGQAAILDVAAAHNQNCASIRVPGSGVLPEWVYWCLAERYDRTRRQGAGNNQPALNKARVQEIEIPIPPASVQRLLVARIEKLASTVAATSRALEGLATHCVALRRSLLQAALTGRLVAQDPADEPAELLLKRVADERAPSRPTSRRRSRPVSVARAAAAAPQLAEESA